MLIAYSRYRTPRPCVEDESSKNRIGQCWMAAGFMPELEDLVEIVATRVLEQCPGE